MYNYKHTDISCPECEHPTVEDTHKGETFCTYCGLVLHDNTIPRITMLMKENKKTKEDKKQEDIVV